MILYALHNKSFDARGYTNSIELYIIFVCITEIGCYVVVVFVVVVAAVISNAYKMYAV